HCWWEYRLVQPLWKSVWRYLRHADVLLYLPRITFAILGFSWFHINFRIVFSSSVRNIVGILIGIALNL
ncbi:Retrovirus-related Pol polyprotein LINE-1, partial [Heterocephalus glaber]